MATAAVTFPGPPRIPRNRPAAGRAPQAEIYFVKRIDNSRLRREVDPEKCRQCFLLLGLAILIFLFGFLFAYQHFQCLRYGYQIEQLKADRALLEEWNRQLHLDQASLADPQRIDTLARKQLGLAPPGPRQVVYLDAAAENVAAPGRSELASTFSVVAEKGPREP